MAGNIKEITIELNGDTTKLDKALRSVGRECQQQRRNQRNEEWHALRICLYTNRSVY